MSEKEIIISEFTDTVTNINDKFAEKNKKDAAMLHRLSRSLSEGDQNAWEELYLLLYDPVVAFITRIVRSHEAASDLAQEVFVKLWENLSKIDPDKNIRAYVYVIARNISYNYLRDRIKERGVTSYEHDSEISIPDISPDELIMAEELRLLVAMAMETMPPQRKLIFDMSRNEGLNKDEIAEKLQISKRTVESHLYSAVKELKELLFSTAVFLVLSSVTGKTFTDVHLEQNAAQISNHKLQYHHRGDLPYGIRI